MTSVHTLYIHCTYKSRFVRRFESVNPPRGASALTSAPVHAKHVEAPDQVRGGVSHPTESHANPPGTPPLFSFGQKYPGERERQSLSHAPQARPPPPLVLFGKETPGGAGGERPPPRAAGASPPHSPGPVNILRP